MMKFFTVAMLFAFANGGDTKCITIRHISYEVEDFKINLNSPYQLAIDHGTNTLFFSYTARVEEIFKSAHLNLKTGAFGLVSGIQGGFANAVNSKGSTVYMGGEDGVYTFDYNTETATNIEIIKANIWQMFYKNGLYFTTYPDEKAYYFKNNKVVEVPALQNVKVMLIAVTNNNDLVYANATGVFLYNRAENVTTLLNDSVANGITSDVEGNVYFSTPRGIYFVNEETKQVELLAKLNDVYGIAIESNGNFIYSSVLSIIRLARTKNVCNDTSIPKIVEINIDK